jgi:cytochrome c oxidase cbb3-type subunit III
MSDFVSGFWSYYVGAISAASIVACGVLLWSMSSRKGTSAQATGHGWDEDLEECNNPLPLWWMWLFWVTIFFAAGYLALYPGLGSRQGALEWSSAGQYEAEMKAADAQYGPLYAKFAASELKVIAHDPEARAMGQRLFLNNCAQCHAPTQAAAAAIPISPTATGSTAGSPKPSRQASRTGAAAPCRPSARCSDQKASMTWRAT